MGNCSYLDTCRNQRSCKYIHYELDDVPDAPVHGHALIPRPHVPGYLQVCWAALHGTLDVCDCVMWLLCRGSRMHTFKHQL